MAFDTLPPAAGEDARRVAALLAAPQPAEANAAR
jgi:hypothetical protein